MHNETNGFWGELAAASLWLSTHFPLFSFLTGFTSLAYYLIDPGQKGFQRRKAVGVLLYGCCIYLIIYTVSDLAGMPKHVSILIAFLFGLSGVEGARLAIGGFKRGLQSFLEDKIK